MRDDWGREPLQPEQMPVAEDDPRRADHELLYEFQKSLTLRECQTGIAHNWLWGEMQKLPPTRQVDLIETAQARIRYTLGRPIAYADPGGMDAYNGISPLKTLVACWLDLPLALEAPDMERLLKMAAAGSIGIDGYRIPTEKVLSHLGRFKDQPQILAQWHPLFREIRQALSSSFCANVGTDYHYGGNRGMQQMAELLGTQLDDFLERGDAWADAAIADLEAMDTVQRALWLSLFEYARQSKDSKPKEKWLKGADALLQLVGRDTFLTRAGAWFHLYGKDDGWWFADREERNDAFFKGLVWMASRIEDTAIIPALGAVLRGSFKPRGRAGVRSQRVGNACIWALGRRDESEAAAHLVNAKTRVKNGAVLKTLEKAIEVVALRAQMTTADLEELAVPDYGLEEGVLTREFDGATVRIEIEGSKALWHWKHEGKTVKTVPATVKRDFALELKELKATVAELEKTLIAQKERLDSLLRAEKVWDFPTWKARYLDHPLMQIITRRLIWKFEGQGQTVGQGQAIAALPRENSFTNARGETVDLAGASDGNAVKTQDLRVSLYHPLSDTVENVMQWRRYFEDNGVKQPFKQAHREIYLLTDAERTTGTYSNRFASHILKQHQFNSLCAARGWKNSLRLMVDDFYPPATKVWPQHNLRAEFWIEGIGDDYGTDTTEAGSYLRLTTDQVRFYTLDAPTNTAHAGGGGYTHNYRDVPLTALPLEDVPALVLSETMRDVDLFVGVSSVGGDPNWSDGGPNGHYRTYWGEYAWGELGESAKSRADVLSRLLPRLKIKDKATLDGRFLRVEGKKRIYKIHLGSANILMEPNDQYLCIVPSSRDQEGVFLPFEGDRTLAVILSKAFLLFDDDKIKDSSILRQIDS